ncbi:hypothetical protein [Archangium lipolyticum]|uniref:hypothetical protein n=1 Tax=Archangium lipolyticum TaxID=2970465 RepID=UPI00214A77EF|nr:hypothetical protein [Archangium lipolyticum]
MIVHSEELLRRLRPVLSEVLVSEAALGRVRLAANLLPEVSGGICLELRLEEGASRVDFMVCCMPGDGGPQALAEALAASHERLPGPLWDGVRAFAREWVEPGSVLSRAPIFWLEYDLEEPLSGPPRPIPFVCVQPRFDQQPPTSRRLSGATHEEPLQLTWRALEVLQGRPVSPAIARMISRCFELLPDMGEMGHVASLAARGSERVRLAICAPRTELGAYLERLGWPGPRARIEEIAERWLSPVHSVDLSLDIGEDIGPTVGFGTALPNAPHGTWAQALLQRLVEAGLCAPARRDAVLAWPGSERAVLDGHQWPSKLCRTMGVKLVCQPEGPLTAKAYPYFECRFSLRRDD